MCSQLFPTRKHDIYDLVLVYLTVPSFHEDVELAPSTTFFILLRFIRKGRGFQLNKYPNGSEA